MGRARYSTGHALLWLVTEAMASTSVDDESGMLSSGDDEMAAETWSEEEPPCTQEAPLVTQEEPEVRSCPAASYMHAQDAPTAACHFRPAIGHSGDWPWARAVPQVLLTARKVVRRRMGVPDPKQAVKLQGSDRVQSQSCLHLDTQSFAPSSLDTLPAVSKPSGSLAHGVAIVPVLRAWRQLQQEATIQRSVFVAWREPQRQRGIRGTAANADGSQRVVVQDSSILNSCIVRPNFCGPVWSASVLGWHRVVFQLSSSITIPDGSGYAKPLGSFGITNSRCMRPISRAMACTIDNAVCRESLAAWKSHWQETKRRLATTSWFAGHVAMPHSGLVLQLAFQAWLQLSLQRRKPAWAIELKQDIRMFQKASHVAVSVERQNDEEGSSREVVSEGNRCAKMLGRWIVPALIFACSILGHAILLMRDGDGLTSASRGAHSTDSDGDGVSDAEDRCPSTAAQLQFHSTWQTDWDGDGCLDTVEDTDDDGDGVPNSRDMCPRTLPSGIGVDLAGCGVGQRERLVKDELPGYGARLLEIAVEVLVGMLLTTLVNLCCSCRQEATAVACSAVHSVRASVVRK